MTIDSAKLTQEGDALHSTTGPATTYWMNDASASGDCTVKATFNEPKYIKLNSDRHPTLSSSQATLDGPGSTVDDGHTTNVVVFDHLLDQKRRYLRACDP